MVAAANRGQPSKVLYVDDEPENLKLFRLQFEDDFAVATAENGAAALKLLAQETFGVVLTDERMPGMRGVDLLAHLSEHYPESIRIIVSAYSDSERLLSAINRGHAHEYILKPWDFDELQACLQRSLVIADRRRALHAQAGVAQALVEDVRQQYNPEQIIGSRGGLQRVLDVALKAANSDSSLLILGETGTGKELLARMIHQSSPRANGPFVRVNCAALSEGVLESELFGHERGAFTGADRMRRGRFELAHQGTLFLDEIGDISSKVQISLLRVLQERELERVGGSETIHVNVRVIAATHQDLAALVREGTFRSDLHFRLNVIPILLPALRERAGDIPALLQHFIQKHGGHSRTVTAAATEALKQYSWPGNVRELENFVQRALVLSSEPELDLDDFVFELKPHPESGIRREARDLERDELRALLLRHGGNFAQAARSLGIPRTTLLSRAKRYGLA
jgi:DNA-binding NtrC family response regulator